ncbi:MAG: hydrogenase 4 subunit B [Alphaproteobacteria bacterium]|nr:hydrogenase 4 subunit B [Alphaproteobacteria bacterium]
MTLIALLWCIAAWLGLSVFAVVVARTAIVGTIVYAACLAIGMLGLSAGLEHLIAATAPAETIILPLGLPWLGANFRLDNLSAFFVLVVDLGAATASLYALGYGRHESEQHRVLPFYPAFLAAMNLVVLADDAFTFLVSWELMSLVSWALVVAHHHDRENIRAGYVYLLMASFGTVALLLAFGLLAGPEGSYAFAELRLHPPSETLAAAVLALTIVGTGSKAGLIPLHVWLPLAHPAAPSHVSALMSGVMTKVAVYAFIRIVFTFLGPPQWWWALPVLIAGAASAVIGVLYALNQSDLKKLLAYSTIDNIGVIFIGLGLALAFQTNALGAAAALAMAAALLHVFNHALFKSLLFFGAGAVLTSTGERNLERLGGLIHTMPVTAFLFLLASMAICALPPLNGFVSEWLTFQAVLISPQLPQWSLRLIVPAVGAMLALAAALTAACFVKAFGFAFLGRPRSDVAKRAVETDTFSLAGMFSLGALCLFIGILPGFVIDRLAPVTQFLLSARLPVQADVPWLSIIPISEGRSSYNGLLVFLFILISSLGAVLVIHTFASRKVRRSAAWDCGFPDPRPVTQYSADSFVQPLRRVYGTLVFLAREKVQMPTPGEMSPARFTVTMQDLAWRLIYSPIVHAVEFSAERLNVLQFMTIRRYLALVFSALIFLLIVLASWT